MRYVREGRPCAGEDCKKKATATTRWSAQRGGWDKASGLCQPCFERVYQGRLFEDEDLPEDDGSLEAPGVGVEAGWPELPIGSFHAPVTDHCPECGEEMIAWTTTKKGTFVKCEREHTWKTELVVKTWT